MRLVGAVITFLMVTDEDQLVACFALGIRQTPLQQCPGLGQRQGGGFFYMSDAAAREKAVPGRPTACAGANLAGIGVGNDPSPVRICFLENSARWASGPH